MIKLINGRGQLGDKLAELMEKKNSSADAIIYHTWNIEDKSEPVQRECYEKFKSFVDKTAGRIIFISTYSEKENFYNHYKHLAEAYLISHNPQGYVIRLPTLVGKGICSKFRNNEAEAEGEMELMSVEDAAKKVLELSEYSGLIRSFRIKGVIIPASFAKRLILFGKEGK